MRASPGLRLRALLASLVVGLGLSAAGGSEEAWAQGDREGQAFVPPWELRLPARPPRAETGSAFLTRLRGKSAAEYEAAALEAILRGNVPDFERELEPVWVEGVDRQGAKHTAVIHVLRDYLALGSNEDFVLIPLTPHTAQAIADATGTLLPTRRMVDAIYEAAEFPLPPRWIPGGPVHDASDRRDFEAHKAIVDEQRKRRAVRLDALVAGDKKDVILTRELLTKPGRVAIYGWHRRRHEPVQPLATIHSSTYMDYSHGIRLVAETVLIDGELRSLHDVLVDPTLAWALSDEGAVGRTRYRR